MFGKLILWLCSVVFAFSLGAQSADPSVSDSELKQRVRDHMDVIVDEAAGIADDIAEEISKDERVQQAGEFMDSVKEIVDNTRQDIEDHFGSKPEDTAEGETVEGEAVPAEEGQAEAPVEEAPVEEPATESVEESPRSDG